MGDYSAEKWHPFSTNSPKVAKVGPEGAQGLPKDTKMEPEGPKMEPRGLPNRGLGPQNCGEKGARVSSFQFVISHAGITSGAHATTSKRIIANQNRTEHS